MRSRACELVSASLSTSGTVLLFVLVASQVAYSFDLVRSPLTRIAIAAAGAAMLLLLLWVVGSIAFAVVCWRRASFRFKAVLAANTGLAFLWPLAEHLRFYRTFVVVGIVLLAALASVHWALSRRRSPSAP
jgi:uncharacterized membrane protein